MPPACFELAHEPTQQAAAQEKGTRRNCQRRTQECLQHRAHKAQLDWQLRLKPDCRTHCIQSFAKETVYEYRLYRQKWLIA